MGISEDSLTTLKDICSENSIYSYSMQITSYNNLLYTSVISGAGSPDDIDESYNKLSGLLSLEENKVHDSDNIQDTIRTYKLYKSSTKLE
jgi:5,10-methylenetetrahydrofolate reductase